MNQQRKKFLYSSYRQSRITTIRASPRNDVPFAKFSKKNRCFKISNTMYGVV